MLLDRIIHIKVRKISISLKRLLPFAWLFGLLAGRFSADAVGFAIGNIMRSAVNVDNSFVMQVLISALWLFLVYLAICKKKVLVLPIVFSKAWKLGFLGKACSIAFKDAGWLIRCLLLFSSYSCALMLLLFCFLGFHQSGKQLRLLLFKFLPVTLVVAIIDHYFISSFLRSLF